ncbi:MAG: hypothetical protein HY005_00015, partial [Candidatus Staskawiczbacteria bacterium]|nr:hypothetical protein [Candidatus Staskawiczbacteria bacterium]
RSTPVLGDAIDAKEAISGKDTFSGNSLSWTDRALSGLSAVVPFVAGGMMRKVSEMASIERNALPKNTQGVVNHLKSNEFMKSPEGHYYPYGHEYRNDPVNGKSLLPIQDKGYYTSWDTHDKSNRGVERLVTGKSGEVYYSNTHYGKTGDPAFLKVTDNK